MWVLRRTPDCQCFIGFTVVCHHAARLHCHRSKPLVNETCSYNDASIRFRLLKDLVHLVRGWMDAMSNVGAKLFVQQWGIWLHGFLNINDDGKRLVIHL